MRSERNRKKVCSNEEHSMASNELKAIGVDDLDSILADLEQQVIDGGVRKETSDTPFEADRVRLVLLYVVLAVAFIFVVTCGLVPEVVKRLTDMGVMSAFDNHQWMKVDVCLTCAVVCAITLLGPVFR